ncbi:MAG: HAD family hydrolase [Oscillospiraceae bacterium]
MIKNIILDIGDVLAKSNYHEFFLNKGYDEETVTLLEKATFFSPVWKELDRGVWDFSQILDGFVKNAPELESQLRTVFNNMSGFIKAFPYAVDWVCSLKESGLKVFCLSNISGKICDDCAEELEFLKCVDGKILSYEERLIKPDPEIFKHLLDRYGLFADECIFIDDIEQNVIAANELGIHGIVFKDHRQAMSGIAEKRRALK